MFDVLKTWPTWPTWPFQRSRAESYPVVGRAVVAQEGEPKRTAMAERLPRKLI